MNRRRQYEMDAAYMPVVVETLACNHTFTSPCSESKEAAMAKAVQTGSGSVRCCAARHKLRQHRTTYDDATVRFRDR